MLRLLGNRNVIFGLAVGLGLALPQGARWTASAMMPALALVMTLATIHVPNSYFRDPRAILAPSLAGIAMTYIVLGGVILTASALVVRDPNLWIGFVLIAGGLAIALFEKEAPLPSAVYSVFMIVYILWLDLRHQRRKRRLTA